ncbi:aldo/keto reductase [Paracoccus mutanolyticus]
MERVGLGGSEVMVSAVSLGTMTFGNQTARDEAHRQLDMALDAGIGFLDTAEMYPVNPVRRETVGRSEEILGAWLALRGNRDRVQIATKAIGPSDKVRPEGYDGSTIGDIINRSLRRLGTDCIDLYQLHWPVRGSYAFRQNRPAPFGTGPAAHARPHRLGGRLQWHEQDPRLWAGNHEQRAAPARIDAAERLGGPRVASAERLFAAPPALRHRHGRARGERKRHPAGLFAASRRASDRQIRRRRTRRQPGGGGSCRGRIGRPGRAAHPARGGGGAAWHALAAELGLDPRHMAIAFTRQRPFACIPIIGATTCDQLDHLLRGLDLVLTPDALRRIDRLHRDHPLPY